MNVWIDYFNLSSRNSSKTIYYFHTTNSYLDIQLFNHTVHSLTDGSAISGKLLLSLQGVGNVNNMAIFRINLYPLHIFIYLNIKLLESSDKLLMVKLGHLKIDIYH